MPSGLDVTSLDFSPSSPQSAQFTIAIPDTWDLGAISLELHWSHGAGASAFGVVWKIFAIFLKDGDPILGPLSNVSVVDDGGIEDDLYVADRTEITPAGVKQAGGEVGIIIQRDTTNAADTLDVDARLMGVRLFFGADRPNENTQQVFPTPPAALDAETIVWRDQAIALGGTFLSDSIALADALIVAIKATAYSSKIVYLLPLLGGNLATARVPLRQATGSVGPAFCGTFGFVEADFSQATGLQADGSTKYFRTGAQFSMLQPPNKWGGMGYWERNVAGGTGLNNYCCGARASQLWDLFWDDTTPRQIAGWSTGAVTNLAASGNDHLYSQSKNATDLTLYKNGAAAATTATNNSSPTGDPEIFVCAVDASFLGKTRCGVFYLTDGTMTVPEIAAFHTLLQTYLIGATGR